MLALLGYSALFLLELGTLGAIAYYASHADERRLKASARPPEAGPSARAQVTPLPAPPGGSRISPPRA